MAYQITQNDIDLFTNNHVILTVGLMPSLVGDSVDYGDTLTFDAMDGYLINSISVEYEMFVTGTFNVTSDKKQATLTIPDGGFADVNLQFWHFSVVVDGDAPVDPEPEPEPEPTIDGYTYTKNDYDKITASKGQLFSNDVLLNVGGMFVSGDDVEIRPLENYAMNLVSFVSNDGYYKTFDILDGIASATMSNWNTTWDSPPDIGLPVQNSQLVGASFQDVEFENVEPTPPDVEPSKGVNDVYRVDSVNMRTLANSDFEVFVGGAPENPEFKNYGQYILGMIKLPFDVPSELVQDTDVLIKLKDETFSAKGDLLFTDVLRYDLGVIQVSPDDNNFLDYDGVTCFLHLPYCDSFNIDVDYVIGCDIGIYYDINLYDGMANINVTSSKIDGVVVTKQVDMGITVPFANIDQTPTKNDPRNVELGGDNGIKTPYIEILKNDAVLPYGFFTTPIVDESLLLNQVGFIKIGEIDLQVKASKDEKEMIGNLISQGVIIK